MIEVENIGRHFGDIKAVDGISFTAKKGEVLGFLGPNGAGKSTTMKMLTCFLTPSFGTARIDGHDIINEAIQVRSKIGYLPENAPLYGEMTVEDFLSFVSEIRSLENKKEAINSVVEKCFLHDVLRQKIETLSKGFKRRVGLAQALIHDPDILILDEPTDGLDPNQKYEVRALINQMAQSKCIILSTHILEEVDSVCTRAIIISNGKKVEDSTPEQLRKKSSTYGNIVLVFKNNSENSGADFSEKGTKETDAEQGIKNKLEKIGKIKVNKIGSRTEYNLISDDSMSSFEKVTKLVKENSWKPIDLRLDSGQLENVFREATKCEVTK